MPTAHPHAAARTTTRRRTQADAIKLLKADHAEVKKMFGEYDKMAKAEAAADERRPLALEICAKLKIHTTLEEEIFYPAARHALGAEHDLIDEAEVEHASAKDLIAQIEGMSPGDEMYDAKVKVLGEYVMHHVKEEQNELFPKVSRKLDLKVLGEEMAERKEALVAELGMAH